MTGAVHTIFERATCKRSPQELYRMSGPHCDTYQFQNLASDPQYAVVVRDLNSLLTAELKATADPRILGTGDSF
jgi:hypothetical protein